MGNKYGYNPGGASVGGGMKMGGGMQNLMKQAQQMQQKLTEAQQQLEEITVEGKASGLVSVTCNGKKKILSVSIKPEAVDPDDVEMLEDLVLAAINDAYTKAEQEEEKLMAPFAAMRGMF